MGGVMSQVLPGLFVGGIGSAKANSQLDEYNITHICTVLHYEHLDKKRKQKIFLAADTADVDLTKYFQESCFFIHEARVEGGAVLVHCACGVSRSVTITLAYLLVLTDMSLGDLMKAVKGARQCAYPNPGFYTQLDKFAKSPDRLKLREKLFSHFGKWPDSNMEQDTEFLRQNIINHTKSMTSFAINSASNEDKNEERDKPISYTIPVRNEMELNLTSSDTDS